MNYFTKTQLECPYLIIALGSWDDMPKGMENYNS